MTQYSSIDIYNQLKEEILTFKLLPGETISEIETAKRFGVSRTPTRDSLKRLELDGLIKIVPQKGSFVSPINLVKIIDYIYMREQIEIGVALDAMNVINTYSLKQMELALISQKTIINDTTMELRDKAHVFHELDNEFHRLIFNVINKSSIWYSFKEMMPDYTRFRAVSSDMHTQEGLRDLYEHHALIVKYIGEKDVENLRKCYHEHINTGVNAITALLQYREDYFV